MFQRQRAIPERDAVNWRNSMMSIRPASVSALAALRMVNMSVDTTQQRIATGLRIGSAKDNPAIWSIAERIKSEIAGSDAIEDGIHHVKVHADIAASALKTVGDLVSEMRTIVVAAQASNADKTLLQAQFSSLQTQIKAVVAQSGVNGANWLDGSASSNPAVTVSPLDGSSAQTLSLTMTGMDMTGARNGILTRNGAGITTKSVLTLDISGLSSSQLALAGADIKTAFDGVQVAAAKVGSFARALGQQADFLATITTIKKSAISSLIDADIGQEKARLSALQVKQQLAYQGLWIANQADQSILRLFR